MAAPCCSSCAAQLACPSLTDQLKAVAPSKSTWFSHAPPRAPLHPASQPQPASIFSRPAILFSYHQPSSRGHQARRQCAWQCERRLVPQVNAAAMAGCLMTLPRQPRCPRQARVAAAPEAHTPHPSLQPNLVLQTRAHAYWKLWRLAASAATNDTQTLSKRGGRAAGLRRGRSCTVCSHTL